MAAPLRSDLDKANKTISVTKQYNRNPDGTLALTEPKTETSIRQVSIPQTAVDLLKEEHAKHPDNKYMFPSPKTGTMFDPDSFRHTFATLSLKNGVDVKTLSNALGHYSAGFTLNTYTHATRQMQDKAAETMGSFMEQIM